MKNYYDTVINEVLLHIFNIINVNTRHLEYI